VFELHDALIRHLGAWPASDVWAPDLAARIRAARLQLTRLLLGRHAEKNGGLDAVGRAMVVQRVENLSAAIEICNTALLGTELRKWPARTPDAGRRRGGAIRGAVAPRIQAQ
jgi:hypothetical protein